MIVRRRGRAFDRWHPFQEAESGIQDTAGPKQAQATLLDERACEPPTGGNLIPSIECQFTQGVTQSCGKYWRDVRRAAAN